jgi:hypothetical protein
LPVVEDREFSLVDRTAYRLVVEVARYPDDLQFGVVLVGPEPRHGRVRPGAAGDRQTGGFGLVLGVLDGFEPQPILREAVVMRGAIACGEDPGVAGAAVMIDRDAVRAVQSGIAGDLLVRQAADADQDQIGPDLRLVLAGHRSDAAILSLDRYDGPAELHADTVLPVHVEQEFGNRR